MALTPTASETRAATTLRKSSSRMMMMSGIVMSSAFIRLCWLRSLTSPQNDEGLTRETSMPCGPKRSDRSFWILGSSRRAVPSSSERATESMAVRLSLPT